VVVRDRSDPSAGAQPGVLEAETLIDHEVNAEVPEAHVYASFVPLQDPAGTLDGDPTRLVARARDDLRALPIPSIASSEALESPGAPSKTDEDSAFAETVIDSPVDESLAPTTDIKVPRVEVVASVWASLPEPPVSPAARSVATPMVRADSRMTLSLVLAIAAALVLGAVIAIHIRNVRTRDVSISINPERGAVQHEEQENDAAKHAPSTALPIPTRPPEAHVAPQDTWSPDGALHNEAQRPDDGTAGPDGQVRAKSRPRAQKHLPPRPHRSTDGVRQTPPVDQRQRDPSGSHPKAEDKDAPMKDYQ
jgi:hypothetical protein